VREMLEKFADTTFAADGTVIIKGKLAIQ